MDQQQSSQERVRELVKLVVPEWRPTPQQVLWVIRIAIVLVVLFAIGYPYGITLWDWAQLLIVPVVIAVGGVWLSIWFNRQQEEREALLKYLEQMGQLLSANLRESSQDSEVRRLARAWTQTTLEMLEDSGRKRSLLRFLYESQLVCKDRPVISLERARLNRVDLEDAKLMNADLSGAWLDDANLTGADLSGANLADAKGVTNEELVQQVSSLEGATMPNGQKYEDWLKSREEENGGSS